MQKIKLSKEFKYYKYLFYSLVIFSLAIIYFGEKEVVEIKLLLPFLFLIPVYFYRKLELISYDETDLSLEFSKVVVTKDRIVEISKLYFYINREHVWKIYYLDENDKLRTARFVPINHTFEQLLKIIQLQNPALKVNHDFQSNRIW